MARLLVIISCSVLLGTSSIYAAEVRMKLNKSKENATEAPVLVCSDSETLDNCPVDCPSDYCPMSRYENQSACPKPKKCPPPACKCRFNYRRAENGTCIPTRDCPAFPCDKHHESYNPCPSYCPGENCSQATPDGKCHLPGFFLPVVECKPACRCDKTYWRLNGKCVSYKKCLKLTNRITNESTTLQSTTTPETTTQATISNLTTPICGDNEMLDSCPVDCPSDYCPKNRYENESSCPTPEKCPPPACKCGFNYRRDSNGTCIPTTSCPPFKCNGKNEVYDSCPPYCPGQNCSQATPDGLCHIIGFIGIVLECEPACRCKTNYWRLNGECVPYSECVNQNNITTTTTTMGSTTDSTTNYEDTVTDICESNTDYQNKDNDSEESDCGCNERDVNVCECSRASDCGCKKSKCTDSNNKHCKDNDQIASDCGCDETDINICECNNDCDCGCKNTKSTDSSNRDYQNKDNDSEESDCGCNERDVNVCECSRASDCGCKKSKCTDSNNKHCKDNDQIASDCGCDETDINVCECNQDFDCGCKNSKSTDSSSVKCSNKDESSDDSGCGCDEPDNRDSETGYESNENCNPCDCDNDTAIEDETQSDCGCKETESDPFIPEEITNWKCCENDGRSELYQDECSCETSQASPNCGDNEILDNCPVDCPSDYCPKSRYDSQLACRKPNDCPPSACKCISNYRRAANGTCIPTEFCPPFECNGRHEKYTACPGHCPGESCINATSDGECATNKNIHKEVICKPACMCKNTYWRLEGNCVPYDECLEHLKNNKRHDNSAIIKHE